MSDDAPARKRPSGLGRGLSSLLGEVAQEAPVGGRQSAPARGGIQMMPVSSIEPHLDQPRRHFDEEALEELAASIQARGLIQPIVVRPHGHRYQIVAGERRWRAAQRARLHEIPVIVRDFDDAETLEVALLENIQRRDLNAIEEAEGYQAADRRIWPHPGGARQARPQEPKPCRQPAETARPSRGRQAAGRDGRAQHGPCPGADRRERSRRRWPATWSSAACRCARPRSSPASASPAASARAGSRSRAPAPTSRRSSASSATCSASRSRSRHRPDGGTVALNYSTLDQLDMICQRLSGEKI